MNPFSKLMQLLNALVLLLSRFSPIKGFSRRQPVPAINLLLLVFGVLASLYWPQWAVTATAPVLTKPVHFLAMGDWGSGLRAQTEVATAMTQTQLQTPASFVITLGDNIYPVGDLLGDLDKKFLTPYKVFVEQKIRFFPALGNHDLLHVQDQMQYFGMPGPFYTYTVGTVGNTQQPLIQFFVLDTNQYGFHQQNWLAYQLKASNARWKVVYGHHPILSSGQHGATKELVNPITQTDLPATLAAGHADLYLAGHDHGYERFAPVNHVQYIVSGGGGASIRPFDDDVAIAESQVKVADYHYLDIWVSAQQFKILAKDRQNKLIDQVVLSKP